MVNQKLEDHGMSVIKPDYEFKNSPIILTPEYYRQLLESDKLSKDRKDILISEPVKESYNNYVILLTKGKLALAGWKILDPTPISIK
jgi:cobalamin biosynthesis Co2+ chelatase CbiK